MEGDSNSKHVKNDAENLRKKRRMFWRGILTVIIIIMFYVAGFISSIPLQGQYVRHRMSEIYFNTSNASANTGNVCTRNKSDESVQIGIKIQQQSADMILFLSLPTNLIAVFVNLFIGSYSDFLGRKLLFFLPLLGTALKSLVLCFVTAFSLSLNWLYLGATLEGLSGGGGGFVLAIFSYTADLTKPNRTRTVVIAIMEGVLLVSGSLGSIGIGFVIQKASFMYAAIAMTIANGGAVAVLLAFLPETVTSKAERQWSPVVHAKNVLGFFFSGSRQQRTLYILTMLIIFFAFVVNVGRPSVETLYQLDRPFCWSSVKIGYYGALRNSVGVLCSIIGLKLLQPCFRDMTIALMGVAFGMASLLVEGLAVNDWMLYAVPVINFISFNLIPVSRSVMSQMTSPLKQGALFSGLSSMESACALTSNVVYNSVYRGTVAKFRGAVFLLMGGLGVFTATFVIIFLRLTKHGFPKYEAAVSARDQDAVPNKEHQDPGPGNNIPLQNIKISTDSRQQCGDNSLAQSTSSFKDSVYL